MNCEHGFVVCLFVELSLQGQRLMSVADVPVRGLDGFDTSCSHCLPVLMLCLLLALDLLHDLLHHRGGVLVVKKETCACHLLFFHAVSIAPMTLTARREYDTSQSELSPTTT